MHSSSSITIAINVQAAYLFPGNFLLISRTGALLSIPQTGASLKRKWQRTKDFLTAASPPSPLMFSGMQLKVNIDASHRHQITKKIQESLNLKRQTSYLKIQLKNATVQISKIQRVQFQCKSKSRP